MLLHCLQVVESKGTADKLFHDVLNRKDRADSTRNALSVLTRFKFIFFLPQTIDVNLLKVSCYFCLLLTPSIVQGEYSVVLNDYARAKSLFGESDVPLFKEGL
jgi:exocyst complex component 2